MILNKDDENLPKIDLIQSINELLDHPIKIQIFFYLSSFGELSLNELTNILDKSKTTIHHHTRILEQKQILLTSEKTSKNFTEKVYRIHPGIKSLFESQKMVEKAIKEGTIELKNIGALFRATSSFLLSITERFDKFLKDLDDPKKIQSEVKEIVVYNYHTDYTQYSDIVNKLQSIFSKKLRKSDPKTKSKDEYMISVIALPYRKLFGEFSEKLDTKE